MVVGFNLTWPLPVYARVHNNSWSMSGQTTLIQTHGLFTFTNVVNLASIYLYIIQSLQISYGNLPLLQ